jgi:UDP-N-acetylglucosamine acyltransferase
MESAPLIHPTAIVAPEARLDPTVRIGPYAIIEAGVQLGPHCVVGPYVLITGHTTIGAHNTFHAGCVIGDAPQDLKYRDEPTRLRIGDHNCFREQVTIHRANKVSEDTVIGSHNYFMAHCHMGHNARVGSQVIIANGALLAGHVLVEDRANISGNCLVHQFVRVGTLALMQGGSAISQDLPPYTIARGDNGICGLNIIGLRRSGHSLEQRQELKQLYHLLFRAGGSPRTAVEAARAACTSPPGRHLLDFVATSKRGVCRDTRNYRLRNRSDEAETDL